MSYLKITQIRSVNGDSMKHRSTARSLGLRRRGMSVVHADSVQLQGMVRSIRHLVTVEKVDKPSEKPSAKSVGYKVTKAKKSA